VDFLRQFMKQAVPRWASNDAATQVSYDEAAQKVCPCVTSTHSQGGNFGFTAALHAPDKVKALIPVEPAGTPDPAKVDTRQLGTVPHLVVYDDFIDRSLFWQKITAITGRYRQTLAAQGDVADLLDLPGTGVRGNTHMMMDRNSDQVAGMIQDWMATQESMR